jgi:hypothetical protein
MWVNGPVSGAPGNKDDPQQPTPPRPTVARRRATPTAKEHDQQMAQIMALPETRDVLGKAHAYHGLIPVGISHRLARLSYCLARIAG